MEQFLNKLGLSNKEALVYKTLLENGSATVTEIAEASKIKRTSTQEYLRSLRQKGFVNKGKVGNKMHYQAENPDKFRQIVNERIFVADRLSNELSKQKKIPPAWNVKAWKKVEIQNKIKIQKKGGSLIPFGDDVVGGAIGRGTVYLFSDFIDLEAIEILSTDIAQWHRHIICQNISRNVQ